MLAKANRVNRKEQIPFLGEKIKQPDQKEGSYWNGLFTEGYGSQTQIDDDD